VVFPTEISQMAGNQVACGANKFESGLSAVSLRPCGPLALIPVNGEKKRNRGHNSDRKGLKCATLGSPGGDLIK
jgi:hypothetical protein